MAGGKHSDRSPLPPSDGQCWTARFAVAGLLALTLLVYWPIFSAEFTWWDDEHTIHHNPALNPPTVSSLLSVWKEPRAGLYVPVTYSYWWGLAKIAWLNEPDSEGIRLNPLIFHGGSVLLHATTTLLVFVLLRRLQMPLLAATLGATVFCVHPMQAEAVGWASGAKDLLAGLFAVAALVVYLVDRPTLARRCVAAGLLMFSVLAKPQTMATPFAAFVLATWVLDQPWRRVLGDTAIALLLILPVLIVARLTQYITIPPYDHFWQRPMTAGYAYAHHLLKLICPYPLAIDYAATPRRIAAWPIGRLAFVLPLTIAIALLFLRRKAALPIAAAAVFALLLAPVSGIAAFQFQYYSSVTDHYVYTAMIGPAIVVGWLVQRFAVSRWIVAGASIVFVGLTFRQISVWHDDYSLFSHAVAVQPESYIAHAGLAAYYAKPEHYDYDRAFEHYRRAGELIPIFPSTPWFSGRLELDRGIARGDQSLIDAAVALRRHAIDLYRQQPYPATDRFREVLTEFVADCLLLRRYDEAAYMLAQASEVFPGDDSFRKLLSATTQRSADYKLRR